MSTNEIAVLVLVISVSFSIVGISVQLMRLMGTSNDTLKKVEPVVDNFARLSTKMTDDYSELSTHILTLTSSLSLIGSKVIVPLVGVFSFLDKYRSDK